MRKKIIVKIAILSVLTLILIGGGMLFFQRLKSDEKVYSINLSNHIPENANHVIEVRKFKELGNVEIDDKFKAFLQAISAELSNPFYLINFTGKGLAFLTKLSSSQEIEVKRIITELLYSEFPPKKREYKSVEILFYSTKEVNEFFTCVFFQGMFIASYDYKAIESIIDTDINDSFFTCSFFQKVEPFFKSSALVHYQKNNSITTAYSLDYRDSTLLLDGYLDKKINKEIINDSLKVDFKIFPSNFNAFQIDRNYFPLNDSLSNIFEPLFYQFRTDTANVLSMLKFNMSRFELYDMLNSIEKKETQKSLIRHGYTFGKKYSIYSGSNSFSKAVFNSEKDIYFAFKDGIFAYSPDKETLRHYILDKNKLELDLNLEGKIWESYFYSKTSKIVPPLMTQLYMDFESVLGDSIEILSEVYEDNNLNKIEVSIKPIKQTK